jgi:hypothetical protein
MADYYPSIARAVNGLEQSTAETRRSIYDRARAAMLAQLRSLTPPLGESVINREQLTLENAIRKAETESLRRLHTLPHPSSRQPDPQPQPIRETDDELAETSDVAGLSMPSPRRRKSVALTIMGLLVLAVAASGALRGPGIMVWVRGAPNFNATTETEAREHRATLPKITDRIGSSPVASSTPKLNPLAVQKVIPYEEDEAAGQRFDGTAAWSAESVASGAGQSPTVSLRADIEIPERRIGVHWTLRSNDDTAVSASHTLEIIFTLPPDFSHGGISTIPGVLMKPAESSPGIPLAGLGIKVASNFFLISLSSAEADMQRNLQLLKERSWFDIPIVYNDGHRALIAVEKGSAGEQAFSDAFVAWEQ